MDFDKIEELFDVAEKISNTDIELFEEEKTKALVQKTEAELDVLKESNIISTAESEAIYMYKEFKEMQKVFKQSLSLSRDMLNKIHNTMLLYDEDLSPEMVTAYASLSKNINDSLKTLSQSFKLLSEARNNLIKETPEKQNTNINIKNVNIGTNTKDLIESFVNKPIDVETV